MLALAVLGGPLPGSGPAFEVDSLLIWPLRRALSVTCHLRCRRRPGSPAGLIRSLSHTSFARGVVANQ